MWMSCLLSSSVNLRVTSKLVKERKAMAWGGPPSGYQQMHPYSGQQMMPGQLPQRMMEEVRAPSRYPHQMNISVMTYNVLSDRLLYDNYYLYEKTDPALLNFNYRINGILNNILYHKPSIVCLQEVDAVYFRNAFMVTLSRHGYEGEFLKRTGEDKPDGVAILYRKGELKRVDYKPIKYFVDGDRTLDRDNVGMVMTLQPHKHVERRLPSRICVANTHLLYNPKRGDVKLAQLVYLLSVLDKMASKPGSAKAHYYPCFLCGDMNTVPFSPLYQFITSGYLDYSKLDKYFISGQHRFNPDKRQVWISHSILPAFLSHDCTMQSDSARSHNANPTSTDRHSNDDSSSTDQDGRQRNRTKVKASGSFKRSGDEFNDKSRIVKSAKPDFYAFPEAASRMLEDAANQSASAADSVEGRDVSRSTEEASTSSSSAPPTVDRGDKPTSPVSTNNPHSRSQPTHGADNSNSPQSQSQPVRGADNSNIARSRAWGWLTHKFCFKSVYRHNTIARLQPLRVPEVTTQHLGNEGITVDYIFYTGAKSREDKPSLTLIKRYGLLSAQELANAGNLPNAYESSDHLPLVAHFSLRK